MKNDFIGLLHGEISILSKVDLFYLKEFNKFFNSKSKDSFVNISKHLVYTLDKLTPAERLPYERMLSLLGGILIDCQKLNNGKNLHQEVYEVIRLYFKNKIKKHAIWQGKPSFMNKKVLHELQTESREKRKHAAHRNNAYVSSPGDVVSQIILSDWTLNKVNEMYPQFGPSGYGTYVYYDYPGSNVRPHVDVGEFLVNVLIAIDHSSTINEFHSSTLIWGKNLKAKKYFMQPGEILIFPAGALFHGRPSLSMHEGVTIFTSGFKKT